jgi:hypothetical protein
MEYNETQVMQELEDHIRRVIEYPQRNMLNVTDQRGSLVKALERYIDGRVQAALENERKHRS